MCLIALSWQPDANKSLILAANRDEFYARPALPLHHWADAHILAGKDVQAGGTWLGVASIQVQGKSMARLAALTNYRSVGDHKADAPSRGHITTAFLQGEMSAAAYLRTLSSSSGLYNPFNLILFDGQELMGFESRHARAFALPPGVTAVSNADFNSPWPKLTRLRRDVEQTINKAGDVDHLQDELFQALANDAIAPDAELPQTGIALPRERALSAAFIRTADYGTRASSVVQIGEQQASFTERSFAASGLTGSVTQHLTLGTL